MPYALLFSLANRLNANCKSQMTTAKIYMPELHYIRFLRFPCGSIARLYRTKALSLPGCGPRHEKTQRLRKQAIAKAIPVIEKAEERTPSSSKNVQGCMAIAGFPKLEDLLIFMICRVITRSKPWFVSARRRTGGLGWHRRPSSRLDGLASSLAKCLRYHSWVQDYWRLHSETNTEGHALLFLAYHHYKVSTLFLVVSRNQPDLA